jgi:type I restriction enzyme S subunit
MANFGTICGNGQYGWTTRASDKGFVKFLRTTDITKGQINWNSVPYCQEVPADLEKYQIQLNDILISRAGSVGFSTLINQIPFPTVFASYLIRFMPSIYVEPRYVAYFLRSSEYWQQIAEASSGIALSNVNAKKLSEISIPIAPLNEQKRIADKLDLLLDQVDACRDRLYKVPIILKRFRQAILVVATSDKLFDENELHSEDDFNSFRLSQFVEKLKTGPFGSMLHRSEYVYNGVPVVNPMHINAGRIIANHDMTISIEKARELKEYQLQIGDLVLARRGVMGRCAVVGKEEKGWICGSGSMIIRTTDQLLPEYLQLVLSSPDIMRSLESHAVGSTMINLNQQIILDLIIPVPSISKQKISIRQVKVLSSLADRIEGYYGKAFKQVDQMVLTFFSKAFRGELVPQDPNDEPASILLERIRAERIVNPSILKSDLITRKSKMPKMTNESVKKIIDELPSDICSFDDLYKNLVGDYDSFKNILFALLDEEQPSIEQMFDKHAKAMHFIRKQK